MNDLNSVFLLKDLLDVDQVDETHFLGHRQEGASGRVFGGQVLGQALMAAAKTVVGDRLVHSAHNYFIRPGDNALPIDYQVWLDLDGRSFSNRRVVAMQNGKPILNLTASFQSPVSGLNHQQEAPNVEGPDGLLNENQLADKYKSELSPEIYSHVSQYRPIEVRPINEEVHFREAKRSNQQVMWFRIREPLGDNPSLHRSILAYASDMSLLSTCIRPHGLTWVHQEIATASIDHALWIHKADLRVDEWLLYVMDSPWSGSSRGLNRGSIYTRSGELVASVAQEGLIRLTE
ncbi:MAG: acyl-CoA thioesterase II [Cellvibrionaceae bacterium]